MFCSRILKLHICLISVLAVSACGTVEPVQRGIYSDSNQRSARVIQQAQPQVQAPRKKTTTRDPLKQHMLARGAVDPSRVNKKNNYTKNAANLDPRTGASFRDLRLEPELEGDQPLRAALDRARLKSKPNRAVSTRTSNAARQASAIAPAAGYAGKSISNVRVGQYPGKTRFVLDAGARTAFKTRFETGNRVLVVNLGNANWNAQAQKIFAKDPIVQSYQVKRSASGTELFITLRKPGKIASQLSLPPNATYNAHRIVLDVASL